MSMIAGAIKYPPKKIGLLAAAALLFLISAYILTLVSAPAIIGPMVRKPFTLASLPEPQIGDNRIMIPDIGVDITYGTSLKSLDTGALWRYPERGNPELGGNFIIAAHRLTIQSTVTQTIAKSPFYEIEKIKEGDAILVDYQGKRYVFTVDKKYSVAPNQIEIEALSTTPKLTLYTCELGGASDGRVVLEATQKIPDKQLTNTI